MAGGAWLSNKESVSVVKTEHSYALIVEAAQAGDRSAFGVLVARFESMVYSTAFRRLRDRDEAQDVRQDVFITAMKKLGDLKEPSAFAGWLRTMTERMATKQFTKTRKAAATDPIALDLNPSECQSPLDVSMSNEAAADVHIGLTRLNELDRSTLEAFYIHGQSIAEMQESFDAPCGTIKRRLHYARKHLRRQLKRPMSAQYALRNPHPSDGEQLTAAASICKHTHRKNNGVTKSGTARCRCIDCGKSWTFPRRKPGRPRIEASKEMQILEMLALGETNLSIARKLRVHRNTVSKVKLNAGYKARRAQERLCESGL